MIRINLGVRVFGASDATGQDTPAMGLSMAFLLSANDLYE